MGIEWYRDLTIIIMGLSIIIMGLVGSVLLIFAAILVYRLYRVLNSILLIVKAASKSACDYYHLDSRGFEAAAPD